MLTSNDAIVGDIKAKINREINLIQGFQALKKNTLNADVIQRCNTQIRETQSNIDYLQETLAKVSLLRTSSAQDNENSKNLASAEPRQAYSRFDLVKYDCPSLGHKIQHMMQQLQFKLQVENQYKEANERMAQLYLKGGDKLTSNVAEGGRVESNQRIILLNRALKKYNNMFVDVEDSVRESDFLSTPKHARKPLDGKLTVCVTCVRDVDHYSSALSKRPESFISIRIDDVEKARTRPSRNDRWSEEFVFDVEKGHELELVVCDKSGTSTIPVAFNWLLLSDITEEIRKRRVAQELGESGWISASKLNTGPEASRGGGNDLQAMRSSSPVKYNSVPSQEAEPTSDQKILINTWLSLEPVGQILINISFEKSNLHKKQYMGALGRQGAIKQRKEEVFEQFGHQFVQKQFYNIMCCALCGDFLRYTGYQCQDCRFLCHKKCYQKVVTRCSTKRSADDDDETRLNHRIPHRFEPVANRGTKWCCHCGYILPWGRKNARKCLECGAMCHAHCTHLVPDFCGMSMEMANKILTTIKSTKSPHKSKLVTSAPRSGGILPAGKPPSVASSTIPSMVVTPPKDSSDAISIEEEEPSFDEKLPTSTVNQVQEAFTNSAAERRAPPPPPKAVRSPGSEYYEGIPSTVSSDHSEQLIPKAPSAPQTKSVDTFVDFNYDNFVADQRVAPQVAEEVLREQVPMQVSAPPPAESNHKSRRRRRKVGLDDFQFLAVLGKGNFGKVMLAESRHTLSLCAIKVLKKDFIVENDESDSVKLEKRVFLTANKERHPFLLNLHCCFQTENRIYFVMEYISGGDLMWHIQKSRFSAKRAKFYACEVLLGLKHFHDNGIVYRDLKLDNILLTVLGHIKIADYGLCKEEMWFKNTTGTFCGTPEFMAPEIIAGKQYDRSVDWWAFGVLLFQMLLCQSPFKGDDEDEIFNAIEHDDVRYPISMPRQTVLVLQALLTKDPSARLGSSERGAEEVMEHPYFQDVDFDDILQCRVPPPFLPELTSEHDFSNFDQEFTSETPRLTPVDTVLTSEMQEQFRGFSHISEGATI